MFHDDVSIQSERFVKETEINAGIQIAPIVRYMSEGHYKVLTTKISTEFQFH